MRAFFTDRNIRRLFVLALFLGLIVMFRHLAVLLVFFVLFERSLRFGATLLRDRFRVPVWAGVLLQVLLSLALLAGLIVLGVSRVIPAVPQLRHDLLEQFTRVKVWMHQHHLGTHGEFDTARLVEKAQHYAGGAVGYVAAAGKNIVYVVIALILAVVFLLEHKELDEWRAGMPEDSPPRILLRYFSYLTDSIAITAKLQVIVAVVTTLITLPVLLVMRLPSIPALMAFLFVMALIPVVGSIVSGVVMAAVSYIHSGPVGVAVFFASTFVLHKIESYYLTPRLTAKHIKLPGFAIILSLLLFEHVFGLLGLFISFPALYVAAKIKDSWTHAESEQEDEREMAQVLRLERTPKPVRKLEGGKVLGKNVLRAKPEEPPAAEAPKPESTPGAGS